MDTRKSFLAAQFLAVLLPCLGFGSDQVPLIAWSSTDTLLSTPRIDAGHVVTQQSLQHDYLDVLPMDQHHNLFLIVRDKLSIDDITRYSNAHSSNPDGGTLSHLKSAMQSSASHVVLPATETTDLEGDLRSRVSGQVVELTTPSLKDLKLDDTKSNLIIIRLNSAESDSRQAAMSSLDQALLQILGQLPGKFAPYTVVLTAQKPSRIVKEKPKYQSVNIGRHLLADNNNLSYILVNYTSEDPKCQLLYYAVNMTLDLVNVTGFNMNENVTLPRDDNWDTSQSECLRNGDELHFVMKHDDIKDPSGDITSFTLSMWFNKTNAAYRFWTIVNADVAITDQGKDYSYPMNPNDFEPDGLYTPVGLSYHCSSVLIHERPPVNASKNYENKVKLSIDEFQVQPFAIKKNKFSQTNECVGYFTPGIWMGVILTIILIAILGIGMAMLADLKVMDKFDDPKGKTITVNVSE